MSTPRLTVGLPVYNGEKYLAEAINALLGQTFTDFELVIADNASTDGTWDICKHYATVDSRVRCVRQPRNLGLTPNHNTVAEMARGELFKWASSDDLYARELLERCVAALDERPEVVLAHSWTAYIDGNGKVTHAFEYPLGTSSPDAPRRFRSLLFDSGGDDDYGVMRTEVLRRMAKKDSYHHSEHTFVAELALHGPFYQVPDWLYFRRDHDDRAERSNPTVRSRCANMDPRRADPWRHPLPRLYAEYVWGYFSAIHRAPLTRADRAACYRHLGEWLLKRAVSPGSRPAAGPPVEGIGGDIHIDELVAGQATKAEEWL